MKNKKGFTLIELLAIIVILAIIAVITVPLILNIINDAKQNVSIDSAYGYKSALEKYYMKKVVENIENELPNGYKNVSELPEDFIVSGESPSDGWVKLKKGIVDRFSLKYDEYVVTMDNDKNVTLEKQESIEPHVTNDYQEVEYLESTGTQYIDTLYTPKQNDSIELKNVTLESDGALFSAGTSDYQFIYLNVGSNNYFKYFATGTAANFSMAKSKIANSNIKINAENNRGTFLLDGKNQTFSDYAGEVNTTLNLFRRVNDTNYLTGKIGKVTIKNESTKVRYLVPVIRKSDNKPGMLDLIASENIFDGNLEQGGITDNTGLNATLNTRVRTDYIEAKPLTTYTISNTSYLIRPTVHCYDSNKNWIGAIAVGTTSKTATIQTLENTKYIRYSFMKSNANENITVEEVLNANVMLNEGTTALPYEPYGYKFYTNNGTGEFIAGPEI